MTTSYSVRPVRGGKYWRILITVVSRGQTFVRRLTTCYSADDANFVAEQLNSSNLKLPKLGDRVVVDTQHKDPAKRFGRITGIRILNNRLVANVVTDDALRAEHYLYSLRVAAELPAEQAEPEAEAEDQADTPEAVDQADSPEAEAQVDTDEAEDQTDKAEDAADADKAEAQAATDKTHSGSADSRHDHIGRIVQITDQTELRSDFRKHVRLLKNLSSSYLYDFINRYIIRHLWLDTEDGDTLLCMLNSLPSVDSTTEPMAPSNLLGVVRSKLRSITVTRLPELMDKLKCLNKLYSLPNNVAERRRDAFLPLLVVTRPRRARPRSKQRRYKVRTNFLDRFDALAKGMVDKLTQLQAEKKVDD